MLLFDIFLVFHSTGNGLITSWRHWLIPGDVFFEYVIMWVCLWIRSKAEIVCEIGGTLVINSIVHMWFRVVVLHVIVPHPYGFPLDFKISMAIKLCEANPNLIPNNLAWHGISTATSPYQ